MNLDFAFICDYAEAAAKLNALGIGFDTIFAAQLPARHLHFSLVLQLRASITEVGQKKLTVSLIDEDGKDVIPAIEGQFGIARPETGAYSIGRFVVEFGNVEFQHYGSYAVHVVIEGTEITSLPFRVTPPPAARPV
jgi:hypothetical protein